jgi:hypothetical protein
MAWKKGESGNPAGGRSKARQELGDAFIRVLRSDWETNGAATVIQMREKDPVAYVRVVAAMLPEQVEHEVGEGLAALLSGISDREQAAGAGTASPVEEAGTGSVCH